MTEYLWTDDPWLLLRDDLIWIFMKFNLVIRFILNITGFNVTNPMSELYIGLDNGVTLFRNILSVTEQILLFIFSIPVGVIYIMTKFLGIRAQRYPGSLPNQDNEKWFFINGVAVNRWWLKQNCKFLEKRFNKCIIGIPNVSYGIFWDLVETVLQRDFNIDTVSVCGASDIIIEQLNNPTVTKVVFISHSQGTVIANLAVERIFLRLSINFPPSEVKQKMEKLEIYTFACASRYFGNPGNYIQRIEHYVNKLDSVPKLGILNPEPNNSYSGEIYINNNMSGHLLNTYYSMNHLDYTNRNGAISHLLTEYPLPIGFEDDYHTLIMQSLF
jgi:hypothetical protein